MTKFWSLPFGVLLGLTLLAQGDANRVPAYHQVPPAKADQLPPIMPQSERTGPAFQHDYQDHAYELAAKIPKVIYQLPCYCECDRTVGHKSLHSCFESAHGAHCSVCLKELYLAYSETKKGKTPAEIRAEIIKGDWDKIDLASAAQVQ